MSEPIRRLGEDATIQAMAAVLAPQYLPPGWLGIGDDCAVTTLTPGMRALTTTDLLVEGVHFRRTTITPGDLGWKAIAVNASDIAGMGGIPRWATCSLALGPEIDLAWVEALYAGARELAMALELPIVGGDTVSSPGPTMLAVTVVGEAERPLTRAGARPGDWVVVTGEVGTSAAGLWVLEHPSAAGELEPAAREVVLAAHRRPMPHVAQGRIIARHLARSAMMDSSDGLARSALWLARSNQLAIELELDRLPIHDATRLTARLAGVDPGHWALYGGEDYHLVFTCPPEALEPLARELPLHVVGRCVEGAGAWALQGHERTPLEEGRVFQHFQRSS